MPRSRKILIAVIAGVYALLWVPLILGYLKADHEVVDQSITINTTADKLYKILIDPAKIKEWNQSVSGIEVIEGENTETPVWKEYLTPDKKQWFKLGVTYSEKNKKVVVSTLESSMPMTGSWSFTIKNLELEKAAANANLDDKKANLAKVETTTIKKVNLTIKSDQRVASALARFFIKYVDGKDYVKDTLDKLKKHLESSS